MPSQDVAFPGLIDTIKPPNADEKFPYAAQIAAAELEV
jgi:hypothetical protein